MEEGKRGKMGKVGIRGEGKGNREKSRRGEMETGKWKGRENN